MRIGFLRTTLLVAVLGLTAQQPASADIRIVASTGGQIGEFLELFAAVRQSGQRVVIDGPCLSACTLVLSVVPRSRICITGRAMLGFHGAWTPGRRGRPLQVPEASALMLASYPAPVRSWITRRGGLNSRVLVLRGRELAAIIPACR